MYEQKIALLAKDVSIDGQTNAVSVFNIIEGFQIVGPVLIPEVAFFAIIGRDPADPPEVKADFRISLDETELVRAPVAAIRFSDKPQARVVIRLGGLPVPKPGTLVAQLVGDNGERLAGYQIKITAAPTPPASITVDTAPAPEKTVEQKNPS